MNATFIVQQDAFAGRIKEYNDWCNNIHVRDIMRMDGSLAVQRFELASQQIRLRNDSVACRIRHMTVYELESIAKFIDQMVRDVFTDRLPVSNSGDLRGIIDNAFSPLLLSKGWTEEQGFRADGDVILAQLTVEVDEQNSFEAWFQDIHLPKLNGAPGIYSVALFRLASQQLVTKPAPFNYAVLYSVTSLSVAVEFWQELYSCRSESDLSSRFNPTVTCYTPVIARLTSQSVRHAGPEALEVERRARAALLAPSKLWTPEEARKLYS